MANPEKAMLDDATVERLWIDRLAGELSADVEAILLAYLADRPGLRASLDAMTATVTRARRVVAARDVENSMPALRLAGRDGPIASVAGMGSDLRSRPSSRTGMGRWRAVAMAASVVLAFLLGRAGTPTGSLHESAVVLQSSEAIETDTESSDGFWSGARLRAHLRDRASGEETSRVRWASPLRPMLGEI